MTAKDPDRSRFETVRVATPGPGSYNLTNAFGRDGSKGPSIKGGAFDQRGPRDASHSPGPGKYDVNNSLTQCRSSSFVMSPLRKSKTKGNLGTLEPQIGPGDYEPGFSAFVNRPIGITIGERFPEAEKDMLPGPGEYKPNTNAVAFRTPAA